jgi:Xaa-Pro aminopeptidase
VRREGPATLVVPALEELAAKASPASGLDLVISTWTETEDPYALAAQVASGAAVVALDDHMWAQKVLRLREAMPDARQVLAGSLISPLRMRKDEAEIAALQRAADAIDRVHARVPAMLRVGRTEQEIGRAIAEAIIDEGHATVDFVIVASGPNGASPHHSTSDRVIQPGDAVVVDIGGTMPDGYCSDCTRTYSVGAPSAEYAEFYAHLLDAQQAGVASAVPGATCESVDAASRSRLAEAGMDQWFIHRTGHGIGLETHEDPYMVAGNTLVLESGMAFSVEPGFYLPGRFGARIEDIVVCTDGGPRSLNQRPRELLEVDA